MLTRFSSRSLVAARMSLGAAAPFAATLQHFAVRRASEALKEDAKAAKEEAKPAAGADPLAAKQVEFDAIVKKKDEEIAEMKKQAMYVAADAENARRIAREDVAKAKDFSVTSFAKDMLEVADTLERAIAAMDQLPPEQHAQLSEHKLFSAVLQGVKMSNSVLQHNLQRHGVEKMTAKVGDAFDPNRHDAIFNAPATAAAPAGTLANVVKTGYMLKERVLRAAQVGVAQKAE